jgi:hypothetical protein
MSARVSKRAVMAAIRNEDDAVGELLILSRAIVNMLELLSAVPDVGGESSAAAGTTAGTGSRGRSPRRGKRAAAASSSSGGNNNNVLRQRVHAATQADNACVPSLIPSILQRPRCPLDRSQLALSRTVRAFVVEPDVADIARCVLYSGEMQRQLQAMFTLAASQTTFQGDGRGGGGGAAAAANDEGIAPAPATSLAPQPSPVVASAALSGDAVASASKLLCRRRATTQAPFAPPPSNELMLSVPATRVRHNKGLNPVILTLTPTHLHVRDPVKDYVQKLPWSHLTSATLGNAPGLHAFVTASGTAAAKQPLANIVSGPRHGLLWMSAKHDAQQAVLPPGDRKKLSVTPLQALRQAQHCVDLQFSGMHVHKDSPVPVDTSRMTAYHVNELWRFEIVCECDDDYALLCTFLTVVGNHRATLSVFPGLLPFVAAAPGFAGGGGGDVVAAAAAAGRMVALKLRPTTLPEADAVVPGGLADWSKQQADAASSASAAAAATSAPATGTAPNAASPSSPLPGASAAARLLGARGSATSLTAAAAGGPVIATSEAYFRFAHTDKYARPVTLHYSSRAEMPTGTSGAAGHIDLLPAEVDFCTENHVGRVEYLVLKQVLLGDPLVRWLSAADVAAHAMAPLRAWNVFRIAKLIQFFCECRWIEHVLVLELLPAPRRRA